MLRVIYGGSPAASAKSLELILKDSAMSKDADGEEYKIVGVLTNPPAAQGRHKELIPTEVEHYVRIWNEARGDNIAVLTPEHIAAPEREQIAALKPDVFVCFAYGHIVGPKFFSLFRFGGINLHPSLLPKYRGATPVNACILNQDTETGFSIQQMTQEIDEGDIFFQQRTGLTGTETAEQLLNNAALYGGISMTNILREIARENRLPDSYKQTGLPSYCSHIRKEDGHINWKDSALKIDAQIRAYTPWPGTYSYSGGQQLRIIKANAASKVAIQDSSVPQNTQAVPGTVLDYNKQRGILIQTGDGVLIATELQWQSKKAMDYKSFMNGTKNFIGTILE
ncbi:MAG: methionyl-tRNA formyltransferase [Treponema sp.]|nr:methionyl-tRNA formyltransferase [Treponema sp.]